MEERRIRERQFDFFCRKPFEWFEIFPDGTVFLCCPSWLRQPIGNLIDDDIETIWNSPKVLEIRQSILDRSYRFCDAQVCPFLNSSANGVRCGDPGSGRFQSEPESTAFPKVLACSFDRSCNLSCPSCRNEFFVARKHSIEMKRAVAIKDRIMSVLDRVETLYLTGSGDPFASAVFFDMMKSIDLSLCPNLRVKLITNGILLKSRWDSISNIHSAVRSLEISVDATSDEVYGVVRRGGSYSQVTDSLRFVSRLREKGQFDYWRISFVVQEANFRQMPEFVKLGKELGADSIYFSRILDWGHMDTELFTQQDVANVDHPRHHELLTLLDDPVFEHPSCQFGNLEHLRRTPI